MADIYNSDIDDVAVVERLRHIMSVRGLSQRKLASLLRLDPSNLSKVFSGKLPVTEGLINRVVADLGVSKQWLRNGKGLPYDKPVRAIELAAPEEVPQVQPKVMAGGVPVYDIDATAGCISLERIFAEVRPVGMVAMPDLPEDSKLIKVQGDSMFPRIVNGGYVAVRRVKDMKNIFWGQIYVVQLEDYRMVKFLRRHTDPSKVILHSENPDYDDMDVDRRDILGLYIVDAILNYQLR